MAKYITNFDTLVDYYNNVVLVDNPNVSLIEDDLDVIFETIGDVVIYFADAKLAETTDTEADGLHTNTFNTTIKSHTFENGMGIITFDKDVTNIGSFAFKGAPITTIKLPFKVKNIDEQAFVGCTNLTSIKIPYRVKSIGYRAFRDCSNLEEVIPSDYTSTIGNGVFANTPWLDNQQDGVVYVGNVAYKYKGTMPQGTSITLKEGTKGISAGAFNGCSGMTNISIPNTVTNIGYAAFQNCRTLASIAIPNKVETIEQYTFTNCGIKSVTIPNSVTSIGYRGFYNSRYLSSVTIPDSVQYISEEAFLRCFDLKSATIGSGTTTIGKNAFQNCSSLTTLTLNEGLEKIGYGAFSYLPSLTSVTIPNSVKEIGQGAFQGCSGLTSVTIGSGVTTWGNAVFYNNASITTLTLEDGLTSIGKQAFYGCSSLSSVTIPDSVTTIGQDVFFECSGLTSATVGSGIIDGFQTFVGCTSLSNVTLKEGLTKIGYNMFADCISLSNITIPNSVTSLDYGAFHGCTSLTEITIPSGVTNIGEYAFEGCNNLKKIIVESSTPATLGVNAFNINANDWYVYVQDETVDTYKTAWATYKEHIRPMSDLYAKVLTVKYNITDTESPSMLYNYNEYGGGDEYGGATSLPFDSMEIDGVKQSGLSNLYTFDTVGEHVVNYTLTVDSEGETTLPSGLFHDSDLYVSPITEIIIPKCVSKIYSGTFWKEYLNKITVMNGNNYYDSRDNCNAVIDNLNTLVLGCNNTVISNTVTTIGEEAFEYCRSLSTISIPNSVTSIGVNAFYGCSNLTSVTIPSSVTSIGEYAFYSSSLASVTVESVTPPILGFSVFGDDGGDPPTVYVPSESVEAYKTAEGWSNYADKIQPIV